MKKEITDMLEAARRSPSVLNAQPWKFRLCGNTIEVYLHKRDELEPIDPTGRLQLASCGTLLSCLQQIIRSKGWNAKVNYFPRFEEENLVAFVEVKGQSERLNSAIEGNDGFQEDRPETASHDRFVSIIQHIATLKQTSLLVHDDNPSGEITRYMDQNCRAKLENPVFRKSVNIFLRNQRTDKNRSFEDELLLSDRFFDGFPERGTSDGADLPHTTYLILATETDNRYDWLRAGEVMGMILQYLRRYPVTGLMALPVISADNCRGWIKQALSLGGYPQFLLKKQPAPLREHDHKKNMDQLIKLGL